MLSPTGDDRRGRGRRRISCSAWLQFASGAVGHDSVVALQSGDTTFLELVFAAEEVILDPTATTADLLQVEHDLMRVVHAD